MAEHSLPSAVNTLISDGSVNTMFARLEAQRRTALLAMVKAVALLIVCIAIALTPLFTMFEYSVTGPGSGEIKAFLGAPMEKVGGIASAMLVGWPLLWLLIGFLCFKRIGLQSRWNYISTYKAQVLAALCTEHFPTIEYAPGAGMSWEMLDKSGLFAFESTQYTSEDRFNGRWGSTDISFAEATASRERRRLTSKGLKTVSERYFRGLIFIADFHKHFHGTTRLIPRGEEGARVRQEKRAALENPNFEALFETWASDPVEVRYLLSSSMLERFADLHQRFPQLRARFHDESLLLLLPGNRDLFEPSLLRHAENRRQLDGFISDIKSCLSIVEALNLNTRIWSKH